MWLMCSEAAVKKYKLEPMARMVDYHFHGLEPERMGLGPVVAMDGVFKRSGLKLADMDLVEINEAFAAQVLSCLEVMQKPEHAKRWDVETQFNLVVDTGSLSSEMAVNWMIEGAQALEAKEFGKDAKLTKDIKVDPVLMDAINEALENPLPKLQDDSDQP